VITFNLLPFTLARAFARTPDKTYRDMVAILASHIAPHTIMKCPLQGADAALVDEWRTAYAAVPQGELHWKSVLAEVHESIREWIATPGRKELVAKVATALEKRTCVHGDKQWRAFVASCLPPRQALRQAPRSTGSIDINRAVENIECLLPLLNDWRIAGRAGTGVVQSY
jgi:hypothetical protein